nr:reverse transcriptase domain-containing protein [Tanacetum cinerariifolium]
MLSVGRSIAAPRGGRTGGRIGRAGGRTGDQDGQGCNRGVEANKGVDGVQTRGRDAAVGMSWEDFKVLMRDELCPDNEVQKLESEFWCHVMVKAGHVVYTDRFHELARMVAATEPTTIQSVILKVEMLTDEAVRTGAMKKNTEKKGNSRELGRDGSVKNDNKRSRTRKAFATITNLIKNESTCNNLSFRGCHDTFMADQLLHHEVEGRVDELVELVEGLVIKMVKDVTENAQVQTRGRDAAVGMSWENFKVLMRDELCPDNEVQKLESEFWCHVMVKAGHICRMVAATVPTTIQSVILKVEMLTDEAVRTGSMKKNTEKKGNSRELGRDGSVKNDNMRSRTRKAFATITNLIKNESTCNNSSF